MKTVFYRAEQLAALRRKNRTGRVVLALVCAATAAAVVVCALRRNTLNAERMELFATAALTLGGWIAITLRESALRHSRVLREHIERILASAGEERKVRGSVTLEKKRVAISRSIDVRGVRVQTAEGVVRLIVAEVYSKALEKAAAQGELTLTAVEGYVTEAER